MNTTIETKIISNGSKWAGESPDTIEQLITVLENNDLDLRTFAAHGFIGFLDQNCGRNYKYSEVVIYGNFKNLSHVFNITGEYQTLLPLIRAVEKNIERQCDKNN